MFNKLIFLKVKSEKILFSSLFAFLTGISHCADVYSRVKTKQTIPSSKVWNRLRLLVHRCRVRTFSAQVKDKNIDVLICTFPLFNELL